MRLIKMIGGLGNQMFIYAFYLQMRKRFPKTRIDLSDMMHYNAHNGYELNRVFGINDNEFCISKPLKKILEFLFFKVILERKQNLETMEAFTKNYAYPLLYFKGFYQSERFFKEVEDEVRQAFSFNITQANGTTAFTISPANSGVRINPQPSPEFAIFGIGHPILISRKSQPEISSASFAPSAMISGLLPKICAPQIPVLVLRKSAALFLSL